MKRTRHTPEQVINKLREADAMLSSGRSVAQVLQHFSRARPASTARLARGTQPVCDANPTLRLVSVRRMFGNVDWKRSTLRQFPAAKAQPLIERMQPQRPRKLPRFGEWSRLTAAVLNAEPIAPSIPSAG
jgi:hypothetical protein